LAITNAIAGCTFTEIMYLIHQVL